MAQKKTDKYVQILVGRIGIPLGADSGLAYKVSSAYDRKERKGMLIHRIEYDPTNMGLFTETAFEQRFGFQSMLNTPESAWQADKVGLLDYKSVLRMDMGTAGTGVFIHQPLVTDFTTLPAGGMIHHPSFLWSWGYNVAAVAATHYIAYRMFYTIVDLTDKDYQELWEMLMLQDTL